MSWHWSRNGHRSSGLEPSKATGDRMQVVDVDGSVAGAGGFVDAAACPIMVMALISCPMRSFADGAWAGGAGSERGFKLSESSGRFLFVQVSIPEGRKSKSAGELNVVSDRKLMSALIGSGGGPSKLVLANCSCSSRVIWRVWQVLAIGSNWLVV